MSSQLFSFSARALLRRLGQAQPAAAAHPGRCLHAGRAAHDRKKDDDGDDGRIELPVDPPDTRTLIDAQRPSSSVARGRRRKQEITKKLFEKPLEHQYETTRPIEDPLERSMDLLKPRSRRKTRFYREDFESYYDICIVGGGVMGCSVAYWLAQRVHHGFKICVIEKDPTYRKCATTLSVGGLRQQFSMEENVEMSMFGADFLRNANRLLYVHDADLPDINFQPHGYLFLASEKGVETMEANHKVQVQCGAKVELLSPRMLERRFPWLNTDGVALASYGYENEGWFDPWALLTCLRLKAMELGVDFIPGDVHNMAHEVNDDKFYEPEDWREDEAKRIKNRVVEAHVHLNGEDGGEIWPVHASQFVIAAGPESGHVAHLCGIGMGEPGHMLGVPLPVEPRKRYVYCVHAPTGPGLDCPLVVDPSGTYFRREGLGNLYLCGRSPASLEEEPAIDNLDVDHDFFDEQIWPTIANRAPAFNNLKVQSSWAGFYDYNYWDQNAIVGMHPYHKNVFFATGFSGHGIQQAPAIGRAVMERLLEGEYETIDLTRLGFDRIVNNVKMAEKNVV